MPYAKTHNLKTLAEFFDDVRYGFKTFELRKDDRGIDRGSIIVLEEIAIVDPWARDGEGGFCRTRPAYPGSSDPEKARLFYTGRTLTCSVTYVVRAALGLRPGYAIFGIQVRH